MLIVTLPSMSATGYSYYSGHINKGINPYLIVDSPYGDNSTINNTPPQSDGVFTVNSIVNFDNNKPYQIESADIAVIPKTDMKLDNEHKTEFANKLDSEPVSGLANELEMEKIPIQFASSVASELLNVVDNTLEQNQFKCSICLDDIKNKSVLSPSYCMCISCGVIVHSTCGLKTKSQCGYCRYKSTDTQPWYYTIKQGHTIYQMLKLIPTIRGTFANIAQVKDSPVYMFNQLELQYRGITDMFHETMQKCKTSPNVEALIKMNLELTNNLMKQSFKLNEMDQEIKHKLDSADSLLTSAQLAHDTNLKKSQELASEFEKLSKLRRYIGAFVTELDNTIPKEIDTLTSTANATKQIKQWQSKINSSNQID